MKAFLALPNQWRKRISWRESNQVASRGFTLLEVVVAVFIAALCFAALQQLFSNGMRSADLSTRYTRAVTLAETLLAGAGVEASLQDGAISGDSNNGEFAWSLSVSAEPTTEFGDLLQTPYLLKRLTVRVVLVDLDIRSRTGNERAVELTSLRVVPRPPGF